MTTPAESDRVRRIWDRLAPRYDEKVRLPERLLFAGGRDVVRTIQRAIEPITVWLEEVASQLACVDRVVDRGDADAEELGGGGHRDEVLGPQELALRPPQIRRNLFLEPLSTCSTGSILWQVFHAG